MDKIIYHGSQIVLDNPTYGVGKKYNDYGLGFYCTENIELAKEWACFTKENGYANQYSLEMDDLKILNLNSKEFHILNWLAILIENRTFQFKNELSVAANEYIHNHFYVPYDHYDIIIGYRADDSYFSFAEDFLQGIISLKLLSQAMRLGQLEEQIVLKSPKAFQQLTYMKSIEVPYITYLSKRIERDHLARQEYIYVRKESSFQTDDIYMLDIIREEMKNDDPRLR